jgi:hypothetical protein
LAKQNISTVPQNTDEFEDWQTLPNLDECRFLILKIIEQAVRDFISLEGSTAPIEQFGYETAVDFLFKDDYEINWGDTTITFCDLLDFLDVDIEWFREKVLQAKERKNQRFTLTEN